MAKRSIGSISLSNINFYSWPVSRFLRSMRRAAGINKDSERNGFCHRRETPTSFPGDYFTFDKLTIPIDTQNRRNPKFRAKNGSAGICILPFRRALDFLGNNLSPDTPVRMTVYSCVPNRQFFRSRVIPLRG